MTVRIASRHVPISVNKAYRNATSKDRVKGRIKTEAYSVWKNAFLWDVKTAMVHQKPIKGPYEIEITIDRSTRHKLADVTNFEKVCADALQSAGVIENDRFVERSTIQWGDALGGVSIVITPYPIEKRKEAQK